MLKSLLSHTSSKILNDAIQAELQASQLYKHLANQCQRLGLFGAAKFFKNESSEELAHYDKIAEYFNDRGAVATLPEIDAEDEAVSDLEAALTVAYEAEVDLGAQYSKWYSSVLGSDPVTAQFLLQFIEIQRKAVGEYGDLLTRLQLVGDDKAALLIFDQELGK